MYSNFNALSPYSPAVASPTPSVVNRWEAADELPEVAASETTVAAASGWLFAADNVQTASNAVDSSAYPLFDIATSSAVAAPQAYEDSESVQDFGLNINSWGQRIDSAAHRLASNVGGIIVQFIPSTAQAMSLFGNEDVPEAASTTAPAPFYWF
ncbi:hypothetical protein EV174_006324 [Coemansia sp. RSA 2320]|nr:hypothetical protein EV174_006324 [Coemansia sp. RSA 2320]